MKGVYATLVRRELWEAKSLWIAPLVGAGASLGASLFAAIRPEPGKAFNVPLPELATASQHWGANSLMFYMAFLGSIAGLAVFFYLLDCLFAERRDRSILFWKSLPVSDAQTVFAKLVVAMLVVPLGVILLALLMQPVQALIMWTRSEAMRAYIDFGMFAAWPRTLAHAGLLWAFSLLWFAPVAAYLMLASVVARRAPLLYAGLPLLMLVVSERLLVPNHTRIWQVVGERLFPWPAHLSQLIGPEATGRLEQWMVAFLNPDLWIGLAVAAGMLYIVIRLRRYRDDT